jgi:hypothetical protein
MGTKYAVLLIAIAQILPAQDRDWEKLQRLDPGDRVGVLLSDHKSLTGGSRNLTVYREAKRP